METAHASLILSCTGASAITGQELIQDLWSGYGKIMRVNLAGASMQSIVVKHVQIPNQQNHPRGWNSSLGHDRKLKSYQVETYWYKGYSKNCLARLPKCFAIDKTDKEVLMVLEDLNHAGYPVRKTVVTWKEITKCLQWLAQFHASYLNVEPMELWKIGTYWHLDTRPEEWEAMQDLELKKAAALIDEKLNNCVHKTLVHGDAKLANFCFSNQGEVAGLDFQYVGGGCGIKDVAYFIGSCLNESDCERLESEILDSYFDSLQKALKQENKALEIEWRGLYKIAWADFHRFLKGWSPNHWKINSYSERICKEVILDL